MPIWGNSGDVTDMRVDTEDDNWDCGSNNVNVIILVLPSEACGGSIVTIMLLELNIKSKLHTWLKFGLCFSQDQDTFNPVKEPNKWFSLTLDNALNVKGASHGTAWLSDAPDILAIRFPGITITVVNAELVRNDLRSVAVTTILYWAFTRRVYGGTLNLRDDTDILFILWTRKGIPSERTPDMLQEYKILVVDNDSLQLAI